MDKHGSFGPYSFIYVTVLNNPFEDLTMSWSPSSPLNGTAQTGFTSPTYTLSADTPPSPVGKQYAITAVGGAGNTAMTTGASTPFTLSFFKPAVVKTQTVRTDGTLGAAPMNVYKQITRKSVLVSEATLQYRTMLITTTIEVPAGGELYAPTDVRAALSCHIGALSNTSAGVGDAVISGVF
jgi:hypothetical protein